MSGRVVSIRNHELGDAVYVGRVSRRRGLAGSAFANPFKEGVDGTRSEVIAKYRSWLLGQWPLLKRLPELRGRRLACWCSPRPCHADVLVELVDADEVLDTLAAAGVAIEAVDGRLRLSPASAVDAALRARVAAQKPAILSLLAARPAAADVWRQVVDRLQEEHDIPPAALADLRAAKTRWIKAGAYTCRKG